METALSLLEELFSDEGLLAKSLSSYEKRDGQKKMAEEIWRAFEIEKTALFEAGTGIGKSLAYLIPALLWSYKTGEKIVISTYTISLQEQLIEKDIPMLLKALGIELNVVLAKGMGNYLCLKKSEEIENQHGFFDEDHSLEALTSWADKTTDGSKSSIPFAVPNGLWSKIFAESEGCSYVKCPHYKRCFFFKARAKIQDADVVIVNHHLLLAHLLAEEKQAILPGFDRLIIDEAHHLEHVARSSLTKTLDRVQLFRSMARIHSDAHPEVSRFLHLQKILNKRENTSFDQRLKTDLPGEKRDLLSKINSAFDLLDELFIATNSQSKWRLTSHVMQSRPWKESLIPAFEEMQRALKRYGASLDSLKDDIEDLKLEEEKFENALFDIGSCCQKLKDAISLIQDFLQGSEEDQVRWAEKIETGASLHLAKLDVATYLEGDLFSPLKTTILCSATLTVGKDFTHIKQNLGLEKEDLIEHIIPSPFDYQNRVKLLGFSDMVPPNHFNFISKASQVILDTIRVSRGGAFVLFTSYDMLNKCADELEIPFLDLGISLLRQGDLSRHQLLEEFKSQKNGVLFGADSFWEGVDVPGDALRLVVIVKLPFPVPSDPLLEARSEHLKKEGRDPFMEDSVPTAVMKFKQGFGRLMRQSSDRGCVICLDPRIFTRMYGKIILKSLPECITSFRPKDKILQEMKQFYRNGA